MTAVRALTLIQPWATLIACGAKTIETRSWLPPKSLGQFTLLVHAGKKVDGDACQVPEIEAALAGRHPVTLPRGMVVAVCRMSWACRDGEVNPDRYAGQEPFGDFGPGRCYWWLTDVEPLAHPVAARGFQQLWEPGANVVDAVRDQVSRGLVPAQPPATLFP